MKKARFEVGPALFNLTKSLRIDSEMVKELELIAKYEKSTTGALMRMWVQDRIQAYENNSRYKRWKRQHIPKEEGK